MARNLFHAATLASILCFATPAQITRPSFEVASIKPSKTNEPWFWDVTPGGRLIARNASLRTLLMLAYRLQEFQIVGGPGWVSRDQFDIEAKPENGINPSDDQSRHMLQTLLDERFRLSLHMEAKNGPIYLLEVVKNGPPRSADQAQPVPRTGPPPAPNGSMPRGAMRMGPGVATGIAVPISLLARFLGQTLGRPVIDKTGLVGRYDIDLHWTPDPPQGLPSGAPIPQADTLSLFTALREQMDLRLEAATGPVEVLVIDRAQRLSEN